MGLSGQIGIHANLTQSPATAPDLASAAFPLSYFKNWDILTGTGLNQADKVWHDKRTIAPSATDSLDLAGTLTDVFGVTFTLARIKALIVVADPANANNVHVTRPAVNGIPLFLAVSDGLLVRPGGALMWFAPDATGVAVTAGTGDLLDIINGGGGTSVTYDIVIIGASA